MFDFIENCLRHKSEIVIYEAAHAIVNLKNTSAKELASAVPVLQLFCSSPKPTLRFAAIRTLNKVSLEDKIRESVISNVVFECTRPSKCSLHYCKINQRMMTNVTGRMKTRS